MTRSILGIPRIRRIPFSDIEAFRVRQEIIEGVKAKDRSWKIEMVRRGKGPIDLGATISQRPQAVRVVEEMGRFIAQDQVSV